jgi:hypothetical protein
VVSLSFLFPEIPGTVSRGKTIWYPHNVMSRYVVLFFFVLCYDALHVWGRREMHTEFWFRNSKERGVLQDLGVGGSVILKK